MKKSKYFLLLVIAQIFLYNNAKDVNTIALKKVPQKPNFKKLLIFPALFFKRQHTTYKNLYWKKSFMGAAVGVNYDVIWWTCVWILSRLIWKSPIMHECEPVASTPRYALTESQPRVCKCIEIYANLIILVVRVENERGGEQWQW
jgi:hypothetical protein